MVIFHSYVSLPEGTRNQDEEPTIKGISHDLTNKNTMVWLVEAANIYGTYIFSPQSNGMWKHHDKKDDIMDTQWIT